MIVEGCVLLGARDAGRVDNATHVADRAIICVEGTRMFVDIALFDRVHRAREGLARVRAATVRNRLCALRTRWPSLLPPGFLATLPPPRLTLMTLIKLIHDGEPAKMSSDPKILPYQ